MRAPGRGRSRSGGDGSTRSADPCRRSAWPRSGPLAGPIQGSPSNFFSRASHVPRAVIQNDTRNQPQVEQHRSAPDVEPIEAELLPPRHVARARRSGRYPSVRAAPPSDRRSPESPAAARAAGGIDVDFFRSERTRSDEAHVAAKDVPELRQLVHRRGAKQAAEPGDPRIVLDRRFGPTSLSASSIIDRNFSASNISPRSPTRVCEKNTGPRESELDGNRDQRPERRRNDEAGAGQSDVENSLRDAAHDTSPAGQLGDLSGACTTSSTTLLNAATMRSRVKTSSARRRAPSPSRCRSASSSISRCNALASGASPPAARPGRSRRPDSPTARRSAGWC